MVFSSIVFLFRFLPVFLFLYFAVPKRMRNLILFFGSLIFYAWGEPVYVILMLFSTVSDYMIGRQIEKSHEQGMLRRAKSFLILSIVINLGMLGFFKYAVFLIGTINQMTGVSIPLLQLTLPIGISFYTFQTMSYSIDVYRKETRAQKSLLAFGCFVAMFPQLIAGPIVKYHQVDQYLVKRTYEIGNIWKGTRRFILGLGKKVLLANNIGLLFTQISSLPFENMPVLTAWLGMFAYAFQIYFDFSGYSDMAIGLAQIMGIALEENFQYPYISTSITEFWRRWHISLGSWFREYVYIPLGGNRKGFGRQILNLLVVWSLTGIWHGAGWNFLLWGLWFGVLLVIEKICLKKWLEKLPRVVGWLYSLVAVLVGWVFFSMTDMSQIISYLKSMFRIQGGLLNEAALYLCSNYAILLMILVVAATPLPKKIMDFLCKTDKFWVQLTLSAAEKVFLAVVLICSVAYIVEATYNPFLYFRF